MLKLIKLIESNSFLMLEWWWCKWGKKPNIILWCKWCDEVRRTYIQRGSYQPHKKSYLQTLNYGFARRFKEEWYFKYSNWLEYNPKNDACYCLFCYLFASESETSNFQGGEAFTSVGFRTWNNIKRFDTHIGGVNSTHNKCVKWCEDLMMQNQSIQAAFINNLSKLRLIIRIVWMHL